MSDDVIKIKDAPSVPGLAFRHFRGPADYPAMAEVIALCAEADSVERVTTVEEIANNYAHLTNCDPYLDMIFPEIDGKVIGYSRGWWADEAGGPRVYSLFGYLVPAWRRKGIGTATLRWMEHHLREIAQGHPAEQQKFFQGITNPHEVGLAAMLEGEGYRPIRYAWSMLRPSLEDIPDFPLPAGLEVRPVLPEHYRLLWEADVEAFRDHWGFTQPSEQDYLSWLENKTIFQPELWQVAWDVATNQVAGQVRTFIDHAQNEKYNRKRGFTEFISVRRPWRRRGLARALIIRSLKVQREQGMTESALGVDSENVSGATRVYEACGFRVTEQSTVYRKEL